MSNAQSKDVRDWIRTIPDFPKPGIQFRDVMPLFGSPQGLRTAVDGLIAPFRGREVAHVAGLEARGFIVGGAAACALGAGFLSLRKAGKLPGPRISQTYSLEYGEAELEVHEDAIQAGESVVILDDLLATGGTAEAAIRLVERLGGVVLGAAFVVDLPDLGGRARLEKLGVQVHALAAYEGD